jgi:hypothetical protein
MSATRMPESPGMTDRLPVFPPGEIHGAAHRCGEDFG